MDTYIDTQIDRRLFFSDNYFQQNKCHVARTSLSGRDSNLASSNNVGLMENLKENRIKR